MITQQILWRKGTVMIFMRVNGDDCYRGRNLWGHLLPPTYIFLYWQIISYCGERFPFNFFVFFKSESMIFIAICCRSSFCLKLERSLPVASICLPAFLLSFPERQRHPGPSGGSYEDESLMEEQQRQIPGENFSRVSRFLSFN